MKLLFCAHDRPDYINGPNIWLQRLLPGLRENGIDSTLLFFPSGDPARCRTIQALRENGFSCHVYEGKKYTEFRIQWIMKKVHETVPDIFIPNLDIPAYHASAWVRESGIPTVGVLHSDDPFYRAIISEFLKKSGPSPLSAVVCVSRYLQDLCEQSDGEKVMLRRIPYGVPVPKNNAKLDNGNLKLVYAGRLVETQKRISDVTHALCRTVKEIPGTEAVLYGSGPSEKDILRIIDEYGTDGRVKLGGLVKNHDLQDKLLEGHVFVLLSDFEGLPIALMEAMACGLVPVCYNMESGIPELVENGKQGLIVNDRGGDFIKAIKLLKNKTGYWKKLSRGARDKIDSGFSVSHCVQSWKELFLDLERLTQSDKSNGMAFIPEEISLPDRHRDISSYQDPRWPGYPEHYSRKITNILKRVIRKGNVLKTEEKR